MDHLLRMLDLWSSDKYKPHPSTKYKTYIKKKNKPKSWARGAVVARYPGKPEGRQTTRTRKRENRNAQTAAQQHGARFQSGRGREFNSRRVHLTSLGAKFHHKSKITIIKSMISAPMGDAVGVKDRLLRASDNLSG